MGADLNASEKTGFGESVVASLVFERMISGFAARKDGGIAFSSCSCKILSAEKSGWAMSFLQSSSNSARRGLECHLGLYGLSKMLVAFPL